jgi:hypothetical protein
MRKRFCKLLMTLVLIECIHIELCKAFSIRNTDGCEWGWNIAADGAPLCELRVTGPWMNGR